MGYFRYHPSEGAKSPKGPERVDLFELFLLGSIFHSPLLGCFWPKIHPCVFGHFEGKLR